MIGRCTHVVDCREASGMGKGGSLAQRGTFAECGADVCAVAMSPGRRHITKPVCEITFGLREANVLTSTMVLNAIWFTRSKCFNKYYGFKCWCWRSS